MPADCKCCTLCQVCRKRHHTSICDRLGEQLMKATSAGKTAVIHPVVARLSSYRLMLSWEFEPFHTQLNKRQTKLVRRNINIIKFHYEVFNSEQQVMHQLIDVNDRLHTNVLSPAMPLVQNSVKYCGFFLWAFENSQIYHICASKA